MQPLHCQPKGLDVASLAPGGAPASAHGVGAIAGAAGLTLAGTASDDGVQASASHHRGCALGACRFSDEGTLLALAAIDGRLLVRKRPAVEGFFTAAGAPGAPQLSYMIKQLAAAPAGGPGAEAAASFGGG